MAMQQWILAAGCFTSQTPHMQAYTLGCFVPSASTCCQGLHVQLWQPPRRHACIVDAGCQMQPSLRPTRLAGPVKGQRGLPLPVVAPCGMHGEHHGRCWQHCFLRRVHAQATTSLTLLQGMCNCRHM